MSFVNRMVKNKTAVVFLIVCLVFTFSEISAFAGMDEREAGCVLEAAEGFFVKLKARDFKAVWGLLTEKSREIIVKDTLKSLEKTGVRRSPEELSADFAQGGTVSTFYWNGFLDVFDPEKALGESAWSMGMLKKERADIRLLYKKAANPAILKMFREKGLWKVGLVETFWSRKPD